VKVRINIVASSTCLLQKMHCLSEPGLESGSWGAHMLGGHGRGTLVLGNRQLSTHHPLRKKHRLWNWLNITSTRCACAHRRGNERLQHGTGQRANEMCEGLRHRAVIYWLPNSKCETLHFGAWNRSSTSSDYLDLKWRAIYCAEQGFMWASAPMGHNSWPELHWANIRITWNDSTNMKAIKVSCQEWWEY